MLAEEGSKLEFKSLRIKFKMVISFKRTKRKLMMYYWDQTSKHINNKNNKTMNLKQNENH